MDIDIASSLARVARASLGRAADGVVAVLLAPQCAACARLLDAPMAGPVCDLCWASIVPVTPPFCDACGDPLLSWRLLDRASERCARCRRVPSAVDRGRTVGEYEGTLREIIHAFKYDGRRSLAAPLARMMRERAGDLLADADTVVPVPLHPWRRLRRGFNQAAELARRLDVLVVQALWRVRATMPQSGLTAGGRRRNVRGAFRLSPFVRADRVRGRCMVLVDDVRTTGATLNACAQVLKEAGAREVRALTVARAAPPGPLATKRTKI